MRGCNIRNLNDSNEKSESEITLPEWISLILTKESPMERAVIEKSAGDHKRHRFHPGNNLCQLTKIDVFLITRDQIKIANSVCKNINCIFIFSSIISTFP